ncbi:GNAT family N-acetyltransferase [Chelatococcus sp. GCM10030263]|uniref:GNAT family N-acetyltransferase n=1 Tax=Chelatococcus sp. GCM10030263 TaxID=3273387 RepID=UPI00361B9EEB
MSVETGTIWDTDAVARPASAAALLFEAEVVDGKTLLANAGSGYTAAYYAAAWKSLTGRAVEPNPFFDPAFVTAAAARMKDPRHLVLVLVWRGSERAPDDLLAVAAFRMRRAATRLWISVAEALAHDYAFLATPAVDRTAVEPLLATMLDAIAAVPGLPNIVSFPLMGDEGPVMAGLRTLAYRRNSPLRVVGTHRRAALRPQATDEKGSGWALSSSTRKKLRQHRRRLTELGLLTTTRHKAPAEVAAALEEFLALEAASWKGRTGTAVASDPGRADFVRAAFRGMAEAGHIDIAALRLAGKPIAMQIMLHAGGGVFTWKIAYDEALGDYSPGVLLVEDYTNDLVADPAIALLDSCSHDDSGFMASLWKERQAIVEVLISAKPGRHLGTTLLGAFERRLQAGRQFAKALYYRFKKRR